MVSARKWIAHKAIRSLQEFSRRTWSRDNPSPKILGLWPSFENADQLKAVLARLDWYLPLDIHVKVATYDDTVANLTHVSLSNETARSVELAGQEQLHASADAILLWRDARKWLTTPRMIKHLGKIFFIDPEYYDTRELDNLLDLAGRVTPPEDWSNWRIQSSNLLAQSIKELGKRPVTVIGTGPSMTMIESRSEALGIVIACNSAVSNPDWIESVRPDFIAFADPVFHMGPNPYAQRFRSDLVRTASSTAAIFVTTEQFLPLIRRNLPQLADRVIALPISKGGSFLAPSGGNPTVAWSENVLTLLMLPLAARLATEIAVAGCDGRNPRERYFWRHDPKGQYSPELMASAKQWHPAFFRDRNYSRYYRRHIRVVERHLTAIEQSGISVRSVTPSVIPALASRSSSI